MSTIPNTLDGDPRWSETCGWCRHLLPGRRQCSAFPEGIPKAIWLAKGGHKQPVEGDHGIQFEAVGKPETMAVDRYDVPEFLRKK